jgi:phosphoribosyl 1,2-cyclic phosphate phosphodiesterase
MSKPGELEIVILGCGSSGGVPRGDGDWGDCDPSEPKNRRTRCSMLARCHGPNGTTSVLIDTSPDLRQQALAAEIKHVDAVLYTHDHADQTHGIDDLRVFAIHARRRIQAWMDPATHHALTTRFDYIFESQHGYPAIPVVTFDQAHGPIRSVGYRVGPVAYSSDVSDLDEAALEAVRGADLWIIDALRYTPHPTHAHVDKALEWIARAEVGKAVLTNLHIDLDYNGLRRILPDNVEVAFDGWTHRFSL